MTLEVRRKPEATEATWIRSVWFVYRSNVQPPRIFVKLTKKDTAKASSSKLLPTLHHVFFEKCHDRDVWIEVRSQARAGQNRDDALSHGRRENTIVEMDPSSRNDSSHNAQPQCYQKATTPNLSKLHETSWLMTHLQFFPCCFTFFSHCVLPALRYWARMTCTSCRRWIT